MAIIINNAPDGGSLLAAYVSQTFEVQDTVPTGSTPAALQVQVKNNGVLVETLYYPAIEITTGSPDDICIFRLDLKEVVQRLFTPNSLLPSTPGTQHNQTFTTEILFITCVFQTWTPDGDGLLVLGLEDIVTSVAYRVINSVRYQYEEPHMGDFVAATNRKFLTSKPLNSWTDIESSEYLYAYSPDSTDWYWFFVFLDSSGLPKSICRVNNTDNNNKLLGHGVGGLNLVNTVFDAVLLSDGDPEGDGLVSGVDSYWVYGSSTTSGVAITEIRKYYISKRNCAHYRIHFLNKHGVWDYFPVRSDKNDTLSTKSDGYETTQPDNFVEGITRRHVRNRGQVRADDGFEVEVAGISPGVAAWLQELMMTPLAYIERETDDIPDAVRFYPIIVQDGKMDKSERTFKFDVIYSREKISQRT